MKLRPANRKLPGFTSTQVTQFDKSVISSLQPKQVKELKAESFGAFSSNQLSAFQPEIFSIITKDQIKSLPKDSLKEISSDQVSKFSKKAVKALDKQLLKNLLPDSFEGFTDKQITKIKPKLLKDLVQQASLFPNKLSNHLVVNSSSNSKMMPLVSLKVRSKPLVQANSNCLNLSKFNSSLLKRFLESRPQH